MDLRLYEVMAEADRMIDEIGWMVVGVYAVPDDTVPFAYTVGLTEHDHPEFIILGLADPEVAQAILNTLADRFYDQGERLKNGDQVEDVLNEGYHVWIREVVTAEPYVPGIAGARYGRARMPTMLQVIWPDKNNHAPWEPEYSVPADIQPVLDAPKN